MAFPVPGVIEVYEVPTILTQGLDHLLTDHGSDVTQTMGHGTRKSKFFGGPEHIKEHYIFPAFQNFANAVSAVLERDPNHTARVPVQPNGRVRWDVNLGMGTMVGTDAEGNGTSTVRLIMEISPSGRTRIVSAYPY
jgi:hypothetical protein